MPHGPGETADFPRHYGVEVPPVRVSEEPIRVRAHSSFAFPTPDMHLGAMGLALHLWMRHLVLLWCYCGAIRFAF